MFCRSLREPSPQNIVSRLVKYTILIPSLNLALNIVRVMANAVPHTRFQWSLSCLQFILLFLSFIGTLLLSYYTPVFRSTFLLSPCVGTIQFLHKRVYIYRPYSVSRLSWYQRQSLAPFWLSSCLRVLRFTVLSSTPSTVPVTNMRNPARGLRTYNGDLLENSCADYM